MNPIVENDAKGQDRMAPKESYDKPKVTTFGSVAKLTQGGSSTQVDGIHHTRHVTTK